MMDEKNYLLTVSETKVDITPFFDIAINDGSFRDILVKNLLENDSINIYYHSYLILEKATKNDPSLFYRYWENFASLLKHQNSYHRNYGMGLIANLISEDKNNHFDLIVENYYKQLHDEKISTIKCCINNSAIIIKEKSHLASMIISKIIDSLRINTNSEKHQNFLLSEFIKLLSSIDHNLPDKKHIGDFLTSVSNETKSDKIKREIKKYELQSNKILQRSIS